jgi:inhibitor of cysteine peptidase
MIAATVVAAVVAVGCGDDGAAPRPTPQPTVAATATPPGELHLAAADDGTTVRLTRGGTLTITLESNPSTGFSWYLAALAGPELELVGEPAYVPPVSTTPLVGAAGTQVFSLRATGIGMPPAGTPAIVQVALDYKRGFEPDTPPEKTFRVTVEIR